MMRADRMDSADTDERIERPFYALPRDFGFENEHPIVTIPFTVAIGNVRLTGTALSLTTVFARLTDDDKVEFGKKYPVSLIFAFENMAVTLYPEMVVTGQRGSGELVLEFLNPTGEHLPQLRYILNSYIAGDFVTLGAMMSYTGPTKPSQKKGSDDRSFFARLRGIAVAVLSVGLIGAAVMVLTERHTQAYEPRPVFVERAGRDMRATAPGQIGILNPDPAQGEVAFTVNANSGDVLTFVLPCECDVQVSADIFEGTTVLPQDLVMTLYDQGEAVVVRTRMTVEGLSQALSGHAVFLDMEDGREIPARVVVGPATNAANQAGEQTLPVQLVPIAAELTPEDLGKSARVRLVQPLITDRLAALIDRF